MEAGRVFVAIIEGNRIEVIRNRRRVPLGSIPEKYTKFDRSLTNQSKDLGVWTSSKPLRYREKRSIIHHSLIPPPPQSHHRRRIVGPNGKRRRVSKNRTKSRTKKRTRTTSTSPMKRYGSRRVIRWRPCSMIYSLPLISSYQMSAAASECQGVANNDRDNCGA